MFPFPGQQGDPGETMGASRPRRRSDSRSNTEGVSDGSPSSARQPRSERAGFSTTRSTRSEWSSLGTRPGIRSSETSARRSKRIFLSTCRRDGRWSGSVSRRRRPSAGVEPRSDGRRRPSRTSSSSPLPPSRWCECSKTTVAWRSTPAASPTLASHSSHSPDDGDHGSLFAELDVHNC